MTCKRCGERATVKGYCRVHYNSRRNKWIRAGRWQPPVSVVGSTRRLQALIALGHSQNELCRKSGISQSTMSHLVRGSVQRTSIDTAQRVRKLYDELSMIPGRSQSSRDKARRLRWAPPLAWDDDLIDDPDAKPEVGENRTVKFDERYRELKYLGFSDLEIVNRWKIQPESLMRQLDRYGLTADPELVSESCRIKHSRDRRYVS